ncbi:MAG: succinate--CoA ligase subunit alpha [Thaumarchaeota archaeon]|nr:succinate--CoA ligase subunit alpha [Nitrososphaerota archaeon]MDD9808391.1 succinate--CoA ligase subunit alpha [Nitrososphaerota archaeon]MDD9814246.1 succinate--CoA ligase subunit alpha [Nitrososphaerota archaeon]MDD9826357.1 succinate--CoA ligase subunit alpha [Nitrososphaerota archaeon]MDD9843445.1 succinate--CoA ligase subunit alpha [Nitrososphaerota archaeon]
MDILGILCGKEGEAGHGKRPVVVQGMTGTFGSRHTRLMRDYGTNIAAGVTPGKGGGDLDGIPLYDTAGEAIAATGAEIVANFVPARHFLASAREALEAGARLLVAIPEHVPVRDTLEVVELAGSRDALVIGPNTPGVMVPGTIKVGIMPASPFAPGDIAVLSKSGTLLYEISDNLTQAGFGQRITLGIGGDPVNGMRLVDAFDMVRGIDGLRGVVIVGEIGGDAEETLAQRIIETGFDRPVVAYIAGRAAPKEKRMGHAGAIVYGNYGSAESKVNMFTKANVPVARRPAEVPVLLKGKMRG